MRKYFLDLYKKKTNNEKGLTLVELLAVIVILAIISAIAVPAIGGIIEDSEIKATKADAINILNAANLYAISNPNDTEIIKSDLHDKYIQSLGSFSKSTFKIIKGTNGDLKLTATDIGDHKIDFKNAGIADIDGEDADNDGDFVIVTP